MNRIVTLAAMSAVITGASAMSAHAASLDWNTFVIRNANGTGDVPPISENADGAGVTTSITETGQKTAYGTSSLDGTTVGSLISLSYTRQDTGPDSTGTPYLNIWVTDGTNYALIAPVSNALVGGGYGLPNNVNGLNLQSLGFNIYDNSNGTNFDWLHVGGKVDNGPNSFLTSTGGIVTLADIGNLTIGEGPHVGDPGAPQAGYGVNILFGDTQGNFNQPVPYVLDNVQITTAVPLPSAAGMGLAMLGLVGAAGLLRKKLQTA